MRANFLRQEVAQCDWSIWAFKDLQIANKLVFVLDTLRQLNYVVIPLYFITIFLCSLHFYLSDKTMSKMNNKEEEKESFKEYISRILGNAFVDNLPFQAIAELPKIYMYTFGMICQILILLCFVYFIVLVYRQGVEQKFMSLSTDSGDCNSIIKYVSGDYTADENGIWVGSDGYDYSRAIYEMDLVDSALTVEDYQQLMLNADNQLDFMGRQSKDFDLSFNLIIYISWQMTCTQDTDYCHRFEGQAFALTADAAVCMLLSVYAYYRLLLSIVMLLRSICFMYLINLGPTVVSQVTATIPWQRLI